MAAITTQVQAVNGIVITYAAAAAGGDTFTNDGKSIYRVVNAHATDPRTVTFVTSATFGGLALADNAQAVAAQTTEEFGPFDTKYYGTTLSVTYSDSAADLTVAAVRLDAIY